MASDVKHHHWKAPSTVIVLSGPAPSSDGINSKHNISTATYEADGLETGLLRQLQTQSRPPSGTIQQRLTMHANDTQGNHSTHQPSMLTTGTDARLHRSHALGGVGYQVNTP